MSAPRTCVPEGGYGWLCPTPAHRARMMDMGDRAKRARVIALGAVGLGLLTTIGDLGWSAPVLFGVAVVNLATLDRRIAKAACPERVVAASGMLMTVVLGVGAGLAGGERSPALVWVVIPVAVMATRFRPHAVWGFAGFAAIVALGVAVIGRADKTLDNHINLMAVLVLIVGITAVTTALMDAELQFRSESTLDPLTGLLNRSGLDARFGELAEQARMLDKPFCLVLCDLDNFKYVNDEHGHERGDVVLREVSDQMRASLRSFELFYRLGGEEFLLLLPGIDLPKGLEIAETLRGSVSAGQPGGIKMTASLGVSAATGDEIEFRGLYRAADDALYRAKHDGRNLVVGAGMPAVVLAA